MRARSFPLLDCFGLCRTRRFLRDINRPRPPGWGKSGLAGVLDFSWVRTVLAYTEEEVLQVAGWDAVVYLRILRFGEDAPTAPI